MIVVAVLAALVGAGCSSSITPDASGDEIYKALCTRCHSGDLTGGVGPALGPGSEVADQPDAYLTQTITSGFGRMPSFRNTLTEDQITRLVEFLRTRQAGT